MAGRERLSHDADDGRTLNRRPWEAHVYISRGMGEKRDSGFDRFPRPDVWVFLFARLVDREEDPFADRW